MITSLKIRPTTFNTFSFSFVCLILLVNKKEESFIAGQNIVQFVLIMHGTFVLIDECAL